MKTLLAGLAITFASFQVLAQPLACYEAARTSTTLDAADAMKLCCHHDDLGPLQCYQAAQDTPLTANESMRLCSCSNGTAAVNCYNQARIETTLATEDIINYCLIEGRKAQTALPGTVIPPSAGSTWQNGVVPPAPPPPVTNR